MVEGVMTTSVSGGRSATGSREEHLDDKPDRAKRPRRKKAWSQWIEARLFVVFNKRAMRGEMKGFG
jgi:hypothetical protein